jgi:hypothetical protein
VLTTGLYPIYHAVKRAPEANRKATAAFVTLHAGGPGNRANPWPWIRARWRAVVLTAISIEVGILIWIGTLSFGLNRATIAAMSRQGGTGARGALLFLVFLPFLFAQAAAVGMVVIHVAMTAYHAARFLGSMLSFQGRLEHQLDAERAKRHPIEDQRRTSRTPGVTLVEAPAPKAEEKGNA